MGDPLDKLAAFHRNRLERMLDRMSEPDYRLRLSDVVALDSIAKFLDRVTQEAASDD